MSIFSSKDQGGLRGLRCLFNAAGSPPFKVVGEHQIAIYARQCEHLIIDTKARPEPQDLKALAGGCDLLILPCTPDPFSLDALMMTIEALQSLGTDRYRILLTIVPPKPIPEGEKGLLLRASIESLDFIQSVPLVGSLARHMGYEDGMMLIEAFSIGTGVAAGLTNFQVPDFQVNPVPSSVRVLGPHPEIFGADGVFVFQNLGASFRFGDSARPLRTSFVGASGDPYGLGFDDGLWIDHIELVTVPEPGTLWLVSGILAPGWYRRFRGGAG